MFVRASLLRAHPYATISLDTCILSEARQLIHDGVVAGGMTPKTECCIRALAQGVAAAHIVDGRIPHALLLEVFTDAGIGTMVLGRG